MIVNRGVFMSCIASRREDVHLGDHAWIAFRVTYQSGRQV
jgi:hypothetical protein